MEPDADGMSASVAVAIVGLGYWGPNLLRVLAENPDVEVRWICDLDQERLTKYRRRYPATRVTTRLERVLADATVDAVIIATPVYTHYELATRVLEVGKHVFVEKPLCRIAAEIPAVLEAWTQAAAQGLQLLVGFNRRHSPHAAEIRRWFAVRNNPLVMTYRVNA